MTDSMKSLREDALDPDTLRLLGSAPAHADLRSARVSQLRGRVMQRVADEAALSSFLTVRAEDGPWIEIGPLMEKKVLHVNDDSGIESYLLRMQPGAAPAGHRHDEDELCIVLEGDVSFDDIHLEAGDYHFAPKGSWHGTASTINGALIFLQSGLVTAPATA